MSEILAIASIATLATVCGRLIQKSNREIALLFSAATVILIFAYILPQTELLLETINSFQEISKFSDTLAILTKALAVALVARVTIGICKDAGENAVASGVEFAAKIAVLLMAMPLFQHLLSLIQEVLSS